jgi:hypothetical protein
MLFKNGSDIRLFVQHPGTADQLQSHFQQKRIVESIAQLKKELPDCERRDKSRIKIYQSNAPLSVRAALLDHHVVLGWYCYQSIKTGPAGAPEDKLSVWGHDGWNIMLNDRHSEFGHASEFLKKYEKWISATEEWSYG